ncbi:dihydrodipicolinate synthase family protein [Pseudactinotalea sp. Z1748]|uniref:dihydrodipicolinate synthase family protein n=1 Tax=Pseudactinotalea sp. Z1748 TaxID=3413027 RepID=UPI003C7A6E0B
MSTDLAARLGSGVVIPAHPLALDESGSLDLTAQRALTRYYLDAGAHGLAVAVHTTQFELHHDPAMLTQVWHLAAETAANHPSEPIMVAGLTGDTPAAVAEAQIAKDLGYHAALLSPWGMSNTSEQTLLERAAAVAEVMPVIGFYLQPAVGGALLSRDYWRALFDIEAVVGVKTAPFNRYCTGDVAQTLLEHDRWDQIALLTGNDDAIVHDLITPYQRTINGQQRQIRATGGLLGQWAVGTRAAAHQVTKANQAVTAGQVPLELLAEASDMVEINHAVFDVDHNFAGCVPGVNEVLHQQGLIPTTTTLGTDTLSPGQTEKITHVRQRYPDLLDENFIATNRDAWLA